MAVFVVQLDDKTSGPAATAAAAVGSLADQFDALQKKLSGFEAAQANAFKNPFTPMSHDTDVLAEIKKQQQKALSGHDQDRDAAQGLKEQSEAAAQTRREFAQLTATGNASAEKFEVIKLQVEKLTASLAVGIGILAAYGVALHKLMSTAITLTQEKEQLAATFDVFTNGMGGQLLDELEDLSKQLPFTADKLNAWAKGLLAAGIQGDALKTSIKAIAAAQAIMGDAGASAAEGLIKRFATMAETGQKVSLDRRMIAQLNAAGVSVAALAKELGVAPEKLGEMKLSAKDLGDAMQRALITQGAGPLAKLGNTWASISAKLTEGFEDAFEDLSALVDPFMRELQSLASEFFGGSIASKDFAGVIKAVLTPAFEVATEMVHWLHIAFLHLQVALLQVRVWLKPVTSALNEMGASSAVVTVALYLLKGACIVVAVVLGVLVLAVALVALPFIVLGLAIYGVVTAIKYLIANAGSVVDMLAGLGTAAVNAGIQFIQGLGSAISAGSPWVIGLVTKLAAGIIAAIVGPLMIHSPSRVMMKLGAQTTEGMAQGIEKGTPNVMGAAYGMAGATIAGASAGAGGGGGGITVEAGAVTITINGADGGDIRAQVEEAFVLMLERLAAKAGL